MKKIVYILVALMIMGTSSFAQDKEAKSKKPATTKESKKSDVPAAEQKVKLKKDGTPDMRYKENKDNKARATPVKTKKDGTPDMRHKENKEAAKKK